MEASAVERQQTIRFVKPTGVDANNSLCGCPMFGKKILPKERLLTALFRAAQRVAVGSTIIDQGKLRFKMEF